MDRILTVSTLQLQRASQVGKETKISHEFYQMCTGGLLAKFKRSYEAPTSHYLLIQYDRQVDEDYNLSKAFEAAAEKGL